MKAFIRSLSIEERKTYFCVMFYTVFQCASCLLIELIEKYFKIKSLALICESGSILSIICVLRIVLSARNNESKTEELVELANHRGLMIKSLINCACLISSVLALNYLPMSTFLIINNQATFLAISITPYMISETIPIKFKPVFYFKLFGCAIIVFPKLLNQDYFCGIVLALVSMVFLSISHITNRNTHSFKIEILVLFTGIYTAGLGCLFLIIFTNEIGEINFLYWLIIIFYSILTYYTQLFQIKVVRKLKNVTKLIPFSLLGVIISILSGLLFLNHPIQIYELIGYAIDILTTVIITITIVTPNKTNRMLEGY
jgi:drug/metabolite transporter (DMT)-like permease